MGNKQLECLKRAIIYSSFRTIISRCLRPFFIYADFEAITEKVQGCQPWVPEVFPRVQRGASFRRPQAEDTSSEAARKNL